MLIIIKDKILTKFGKIFLKLDKNILRMESLEARKTPFESKVELYILVEYILYTIQGNIDTLYL